MQGVSVQEARSARTGRQETEAVGVTKYLTEATNAATFVRRRKCVWFGGISTRERICIVFRRTHERKYALCRKRFLRKCRRTEQ